MKERNLLEKIGLFESCVCIYIIWFDIIAEAVWAGST